MSHNWIPDDVLKTAVLAVHSDELLHIIVARAILAERERCAKIAEDKDWSVGGLMHVDTAPIASAIRTPSTGEEA